MDKEELSGKSHDAKINEITNIDRIVVAFIFILRISYCAEHRIEKIYIL